MYYSLFAKTGFLALMLGVIATGTLLNACAKAVQDQTQGSNPVATDAGAPKPINPNNMGDMKHGGMMDHTMMDLGPADAEFDLRFIDSMIPHHEGAVVMAKEVLQKSQRPELRKLAEDIIKAQEKEIDQMKQWRIVWYPKAPSTPIAWHAPMGHSMVMSQDQMKAMRMDMDLGPADAEFDKRFIVAMIPHHEGAVVMANDVLQKSKRPEILKFAKAIIASQQVEIDQMKQWKQAWYKP
jgi:uncharacterized protein (DUF305 family)